MEPNTWKIAFPEIPGNLDLGGQNTVDHLPYCLSRGIVAVSRPENPSPEWEDQALFREFRHFPSELYAIFSRIKENDLVWTRSSLGVYYLGRILGLPPFDFLAGEPVPSFLSAPCRWYQAGTVDTVCRAVLDAFEPYRKFRMIVDPAAGFYSRLLYNSFQDKKHTYPVSDWSGENLFQLFSRDDLCDIAALYLQEEYGYKMFPSSFSRETGLVDFTFPTDQQDIFGAVVILEDHVLPNLDVYIPFPGPVFLFVADSPDFSAPEPDTPAEHIRIIHTGDLLPFLLEHMDHLPPRIKLLMRYCKECGAEEIPEYASEKQRANKKGGGA